jgi:Zn-dependent protease
MAITGLPGIGYAKPVPVDVGRLRHPRNQSVFVSLAGPATNVGLSLMALILCHFMVHSSSMSSSTLFTFLVFLGMENLILAAVNLLPIPPFDGSILIERLIPRRNLYAYYQIRARALPFALIAVMALFYLGFGNSLFQYLERTWISLL